MAPNVDHSEFETSVYHKANKRYFDTRAHAKVDTTIRIFPLMKIENELNFTTFYKHFPRNKRE